MLIRIEMLSPWAVAVYVDGEISDCFDCADEAVKHVNELTSGSPASVSVTFDEDYQRQCDKAPNRG